MFIIILTSKLFEIGYSKWGHIGHCNLKYPRQHEKKRGGKRNEVRIDDRSKEKRQKKKVKYKCTIYLLLILFDSECAWNAMYQEIVNSMPKTVPNQAIEMELVPLKKGQSIENALFDVEDDVQINQVNPKPNSFNIDLFSYIF